MHDFTLEILLLKIFILISFNNVIAITNQPTTIWMSQVNCKGSEFSLDLCPFASWGMVDCVHQEDAAACCATNSTSRSNTSYSAISQNLRLYQRADIARTTNLTCGRVEVQPCPYIASVFNKAYTDFQGLADTT